MKFNFFFKRRKLSVELRETNFITRGLGLTFRTRNTKNLLFDFKKYVTWQGDLTSVFVFFPFLVLWLDDKNKVIDFKIVMPFKLKIGQKKRFCKIIELPLNLSNRNLIEKIAGKSNFKRNFSAK